MLGLAATLAAAEARVAVVVGAVALAVVAVSLGMIPCLQIVRSLCLLKRRYGPSYGQTDEQSLFVL